MQNFTMKVDGQTLTATAAQLARAYCLVRGIRLIVEPTPDTDDESSLTLYAQFGKDKTLTEIAEVEDDSPYALFFKEYMLGAKDCEITQEKTYRLEFLEEPFEPITGIAADIAREYCKLEQMPLFTAEYDGHVWLFADFSGIEPDTAGRIAQFENDDAADFEAGYRLFFDSYLMPEKSNQCVRITELS